MNSAISAQSLQLILKMQQNELTESIIYEKIARFAKGEENKQVLERLSKEEHAHYEIWKRYTGVDMQPEKGKILKFKLICDFVPCMIVYVRFVMITVTLELIISGFIYEF